MKHLLAALAIALAACAAPPAPPPVSAPVAATPPASAPVAAAAPVQADDPAAACRARGGELRPICRMQTLQCVVRYADAGRDCRGDADCEGRCFAKDDGLQPGAPTVGRCQASSNPCGCNTQVENGRAGPTMCVD